MGIFTDTIYVGLKAFGVARDGRCSSKPFHFNKELTFILKKTWWHISIFRVAIVRKKATNSKASLDHFCKSNSMRMARCSKSCPPTFFSFQVDKWFPLEVEGWGRWSSFFLLLPPSHTSGKWLLKEELTLSTKSNFLSSSRTAFSPQNPFQAQCGFLVSLSLSPSCRFLSTNSTYF